MAVVTRGGAAGVAVAIQGGAMRSVYCLGAVRALVERGLVERGLGGLRSVHCVSSGVVPAAILSRAVAGFDVIGPIEELLAVLCGPRVINRLRVGRLFDLDALVASIDDVLTPVFGASPGPAPLEVALTHAVTGRVAYVDVMGLDRPQRLNAFRATMALPMLYTRQVSVNGAPYVDGGIADPLPVIRAVASGASVVVAVSSKQPGRTGEPTTWPASMALRLAPNVAAPVKRLMLCRNPLGSLTDHLLDEGRLGSVALVRIAPSRPEYLVRRTDRDRSRLRRLEDLGYRDAAEAIDRAI